MKKAEVALERKDVVKILKKEHKLRKKLTKISEVI